VAVVLYYLFASKKIQPKGVPLVPRDAEKSKETQNVNKS